VLHISGFLIMLLGSRDFNFEDFCNLLRSTVKLQAQEEAILHLE